MVFRFRFKSVKFNFYIFGFIFRFLFLDFRFLLEVTYYLPYFLKENEFLVLTIDLIISSISKSLQISTIFINILPVSKGQYFENLNIVNKDTKLLINIGLSAI